VNEAPSEPNGTRVHRPVVASTSGTPTTCATVAVEQRVRASSREVGRSIGKNMRRTGAAAGQRTATGY
jgi:hypothetical protein